MTGILQRYTGKKGLADSLKGKNINPDETIVSFDVSALFTSIPVPVASEVINTKLISHISQEGPQAFLEHPHNIPKDNIISLLDLILNNCVFSFQHKFYKQLRGAAISSPVSQIITHMYMEYFEEIALSPQCPIPTLWWKRYVDDVICITKKTKWISY